MNKSLKKLLEYSLFPALVLVLGKFFGIYISTTSLGIELTFKQYTSNLFTLTQSVDLALIKEVTSYSDLFMYIFISTFFSLVLFRAIFLHNSHVTPNTVYKLAHHNLLELIQDSYEIYHNGVISLIFTWIATILILANTISERTYPWIGVVTLTSSIILSLILFQDVIREIDNVKKNTGQIKLGA